mmetsp:Transcript_14258/g.25229  ORF Transcript_14258/g.25229 Transcript_14258/m.25229 type:complete len:329 (+) Transcript_14258:526-1512(+)
MHGLGAELAHEGLAFGHLRDGQGKGEERLVSHRRNLGERPVLLDLPGKQEGIANVLVCGTFALCNNLVEHRCDPVHKEHHLALEALGGVGEVPHVAEAKDALDLRARRQQVQLLARALRQVLADDRGAGLPKAHPHEAANLLDGLQQHGGLQALLEALRHLVVEPNGVGVDLPHQVHHHLDGVDHQGVDVLGEGHGPNGQQHNHEGGQHYAVQRLRPRRRLGVKDPPRPEGRRAVEEHPVRDGHNLHRVRDGHNLLLRVTPVPHVPLEDQRAVQIELHQVGRARLELRNAEVQRLRRRRAVGGLHLGDAEVVDQVQAKSVGCIRLFKN